MKKIIIAFVTILLINGCISSQVSQTKNFYKPEIKKEYIAAEKRIQKQQKKYKKYRKWFNKKMDRIQERPSPTYLYY